MMESVYLLAFFGLLRCGEFTSTTKIFDPATGLCLQDIHFSWNGSHQVLHLHLRISKTDPFCQGFRIQLHSTSNDLCPVSAMKAYLKLRNFSMNQPCSPLYLLPELTPLSCQECTRMLRKTSRRQAFQQMLYIPIHSALGPALLQLKLTSVLSACPANSAFCVCRSNYPGPNSQYT